MAVTGRMDGHFNLLWDHSQIEFLSIPTLRLLLEGAGLEELRFHRVGCIPALAESMVAVARRPGNPT